MAVTHLRVHLSAVGTAGTVESDNLVAKHVRAWGQGGGNLDVPGVVRLYNPVSTDMIFNVSL